MTTAINLNKLLEEKGKSLYIVAKNTGLAYNSLLRIVHGQSKGIDFETLRKLSKELDCLPSDIIGDLGIKLKR